MNLLENIRMSWRAIRGHKLRSTLTALGIIIGIAAVITFVTLGASLQSELIGEIGGDEATNIYTWAGPDGVQQGPGFGAEPVYTQHDIEGLRALESVESVTPYGTVRTNALTYGGDTVSRSDIVTASAPTYLDGAELSEGRLFEKGANEAVLNPQAAEQFEENVTVGDTVTITMADGSETDVTVVGLLNSPGSLSPFGGAQAAAHVYVPTDPFYTNTVESPTQGESQRVYSFLIVEATDPSSVDATKTDVENYLTSDSDASQLWPDDYAPQLQTSEELLGQLEAILDTLTGFITGIAVISLVVGSIGIANIMLVSVSERTREIGIMKAVGAQNRDIIGLFLTEAVILGVIGAIFGTLLGVGGGYAGAELIGLPVSYPFEWFAIAIVVGILVGVVAGLYPAWSASRTDPIDALRYE